MAKKRAKIVTSAASRTYALLFVKIRRIAMSAFSRNRRAETRPTEVHLKIIFQDAEIPWIIRYKNPKRLGKFIEDLVRYRAHVWPDAEELDLGQ